jgi:DNA polymerase III delta prime subunit
MGQVEDSELQNRLLRGVLSELEAATYARPEGVTIFQGVCEGRDGAQRLYRFRTAERVRARADTPAVLRVEKAGGQQLLIEASVRSYTASSLLLALAHATAEPITQATLELGAESLVLQRVRHTLESLVAANPASPDLLFHRETAALALKGPSRINRAAAESVATSDLPSDLQPDQQAALRRSLSSQVTYIWGPPGTGKTTTLGALIHQLFRDHKRILVVANTNQAVDGMVAATYKRFSQHNHNCPAPAEGSIVRLGGITRMSLLKEFGEQIRFDELVKQGRQKMTQRLDEMQQELVAVERAIWRASARETLAEHISNLEHQRAELLSLASSDSLPLGVRLLGSVLQRPTPAAVLASDSSPQLALVEAGINEARRRLAQSADGIQDSDLTALFERQKDLVAGVELLRGFIDDIKTHVLSRARLVACTASKAILSMRELGEFDAIVIDEASMMPLALTYLVAGLSREKVIFAGDFRQLPPISRAQSEVAKHLYATSVFEASGIERSVTRGDAHSDLSILTQQFRSHPKILTLLNRRFYNGILKSAYHGPLQERTPIGPPMNLLEEHRALVVDTSTLSPHGYYLDGSKANVLHAVVVHRIVQKLYRSGAVAPDEVAVIAPYRPQVGLIHSLLREKGLDSVACCGTVHRFQGDERPTVILDLTESAPHRVGSFLSGQRVGDLSAQLLNVALSRAQHYLVIVADCAHLNSQLGPHHLIFDIVAELRASGSVVNAAELFGTDELQPLAESTDAGDSIVVREEALHPALVADLLKAQSNLTISSEAIDGRGAAIMHGVVASRIRAGVQATAVVSHVASDTPYPDITRLGVQLSMQRSGTTPPSCVVIDDRVVWLTSSAPFTSCAHGAATGLRVVSTTAANFIKRNALAM